MKTYCKILSAVLCLVLIFTTGVISVCAQETPTKVMDLTINDLWNCEAIEFNTNYIAPVPDGSDVTDAYVADLTTYADVNEDSKVNVKDATAIQKYIAKVKTPYNVGGYIY